MRTFTMLRRILLLHKDVMLEINSIKQAIEAQGNNIELIFEYLKQFEAVKQQELEQKNRKSIGFKTPDKNNV